MTDYSCRLGNDPHNHQCNLCCHRLPDTTALLSWELKNWMSNQRIGIEQAAQRLDFGMGSVHRWIKQQVLPHRQVRLKIMDKIIESEQNVCFCPPKVA